jgi:hypothetical protein
VLEMEVTKPSPSEVQGQERQSPSRNSIYINK